MALDAGSGRRPPHQSLHSLQCRKVTGFSPPSTNHPIDDDIKQLLDICKGSYPDALRIVLVANAYYEEEIERLKAQASAGDTREVRKKTG